MFGGDLIVVAVHLMMLIAQVRGNCRKIGVCSCETDEGVIDLSPLARDGEAMFKDITNPNVYSWKFSYNPCTPYTFGKCSDVAACEYSDDGFGFYSLGTQDSATFSTEASDLHLSYSATDQGLLRTTQVTLVCDHSQEKSIEMKPLQSSVFEFTLTSRYCCPQQISAGLSGGSVVLIVFVAMLLVYIVGGVVFQVGVRKASGKEIIPNYTWWSSLPALIKVLYVLVIRGSVSSLPMFLFWFLRLRHLFYFRLYEGLETGLHEKNRSSGQIVFQALFSPDELPQTFTFTTRKINCNINYKISCWLMTNASSENDFCTFSKTTYGEYNSKISMKDLTARGSPYLQSGKASLKDGMKFTVSCGRSSYSKV